MKPEDLESMLWEERDGTITADERETLGSYVDEHPEARELQKEIEILAERLDDLGRAVPPQDLRQRITEALSAVPSPVSGSNMALPSDPHRISSRHRTSWFPMAACLLIGLAVGFLFQPGSRQRVEPVKAAGTMSMTPAKTMSLPMKISLEDPSSTVEISRNEDLTALRVDLESTTDLEIDLEAAEGFLLVTGIVADDAAGFEIEATAGRTALHFRDPTSRTVEITATSGTVPVHLVVRENGVVVADGRLADASSIGGS